MCLKNTCACMEIPTGGNSRNKKGSPTELNILQRPGTRRDTSHSMLNNPGEHSAASYTNVGLEIIHDGLNVCTCIYSGYIHASEEVWRAGQDIPIYSSQVYTSSSLRSS